MERVLRIVANAASKKFDELSAELEELIFSFNKTETRSVLTRVGVIPESIGRDSTEEKLFSKATDLILARALFFLGFDVEVPKRRGDSADVVAHSRAFGYCLVADAKSFRLSRTAKNQKDYKIPALNSWKNNVDADYAVLVAPYFQYPTIESQIYRQALDVNVCLFSWECLFFLLTLNVVESECLNLANVWNFPAELAKKRPLSETKKTFLNEVAERLTETTGVLPEKWRDALKISRRTICASAVVEIERLNDEIEKIKNLSRQEAVERLIEKSKYRENIAAIRAFLRKIERY